LGHYARPKRLQVVTALVFEPTLAIPFLAMEGGTYPFITLYGGCTGPWKQDSFALPHDPQISEKVGTSI
jgi:hypothetical protein